MYKANKLSSNIKPVISHTFRSLTQTYRDEMIHLIVYKGFQLRFP